MINASLGPWQSLQRPKRLSLWPKCMSSEPFGQVATGFKRRFGSSGLEFELQKLVAYRENCAYCIWGCRMALEMISDQWKPSERRYRTETFCYGRCRARSTRPGRCERS